MATDATGNVLNVPGTSGKVATTDDEILASYAGFTQKGLTLLKDAATGNTPATLIPTGTVLKVSGTAKKYTAAVKADAPAVGTAPTGYLPAPAIVGILRKDVDTAGIDKLGNVVLHGVVKGAKLKYGDDINGLTAGELQALAIALGGRYIAYND
jgi:hypothetical protein